MGDIAFGIVEHIGVLSEKKNGWKKEEESISFPGMEVILKSI